MQTAIIISINRYKEFPFEFILKSLQFQARL